MQFAICQAIDSENKAHILRAFYIFAELTKFEKGGRKTRSELYSLLPGNRKY